MSEIAAMIHRLTILQTENVEDEAMQAAVDEAIWTLIKMKVQ